MSDPQPSLEDALHYLLDIADDLDTWFELVRDGDRFLVRTQDLPDEVRILKVNEDWPLAPRPAWLVANSWFVGPRGQVLRR